MAFTEAWRWFLSMLHDATTWQSASLMKLPVLLGACMPQPTTPMVMRSEGAGRPSAPSALAGMMVGAATAAAAVAIKRRREILGSMGFMAKYCAQPAVRMRVKILSGLGKIPWLMAESMLLRLFVRFEKICRQVLAIDDRRM